MLRPSEVFGGSKSEGIDKAIENAMQGGVQLCPAGVKTPMYPIHTEDVARRIHQLGFVDEETKKTIHINGPKPYSFYQLITSVSRITGKKALIFPVPKALLQFVAQMVRISKLDIGIAPDQVARLYSKKHESTTGSFYYGGRVCKS
ncbi:MAG TPA: hypothetical protein DCR04_12520 [Flavobacteriales bacterium]|nr:hypothetical protein [Flavobacteriales bacterium]